MFNYPCNVTTAHVTDKISFSFQDKLQINLGLIVLDALMINLGFDCVNDTKWLFVLLLSCCFCSQAPSLAPSLKPNIPMYLGLFYVKDKPHQWPSLTIQPSVLSGLKHRNSGQFFNDELLVEAALIKQNQTLFVQLYL